MVTRRALIQGSTFGLLSISALARQARAMSSLAKLGAVPSEGKGEPHFFVFVQMQGAWDVCLAFDPKDRTAVLANGDRAFDQPYSMEDVKAFRGIPLAPHGVALGPYADRLAIINGIDMEIDPSHIADVVMSGSLQPKIDNVPYIQALLTRQQSYVHGRVLPHVYASYDGNFFGGGEGKGTVIAAANDVVTMLGGNGASGAAEFSLVEELVASYSAGLPEAAERQAFAPYIEAVPRAAELVKTVQAGGFKVPAEPDSAAGMGELFGQLFARGLTGAVSWALGSGKYQFDTHTDHYKDHPLHLAMADVATMLGELNKIPLDANTSVGERTTVILASEFCRTPRLNGASGKDHNTRTNSLVLLGHGVRPGVFGASGTRVGSDGTVASHAGLPIDLATGRPRDDGHVLKIRDVWAGLGAVFGTDLTSSFGAEAKPILFLG